MREDALDWLALSHCDGMGAVTVRKLVQHFGSAGAVLEASAYDLADISRISDELARSIKAADRDWADQQVASCLRHLVDIVTFKDEAYPELLSQTSSPPAILFIKGDLSLLSLPTVAIIGARNCSAYGRHVAREFAQDLAQRGVCVVSGLALGIDACAHEGALRGGATAAVKGTGLDHPYPRTNQALFQQIGSEGLLISEFPMGTTADPKHFPRRNRTISGLSRSVVVVEGGRKSGSLLTAQYALEQNRDVFAVPGPVTSPKSLGPHHPIRQGAQLAQSAEDIAGELLDLRTSHQAARAPSQMPLTGVEGEIVACLSGEGAHVDTIADRIRRPAHEVLAILLGLELTSRVTQLPGKQFVLKH